MSRAQRINAELVNVTYLCNYYHGVYGRPMSLAQTNFVTDSYHHYMGRRRYLLRRLLEEQLKEFECD